MQTRLYLIHTHSPLHAGTGQGVGLIDLPIARERSTAHPLIPGSSVKGVLRDACRNMHGGDATPEALTSRIFGPPTRHADKFRGALCFADARILLFPVRSDYGTFAWVTCPYTLSRLIRDAGDIVSLPTDDFPDLKEEQCAVPPGSVIVRKSRAVFDGLDFQAVNKNINRAAEGIANLIFPPNGRASQRWREMLASRFCLISNQSFTWLVEHATEVRARIQIDERTGTVVDRALWYEESLPAESVLAGVVQYSNNHQIAQQKSWSILKSLTEQPIQFGGNATVGQGMARLHLHGGD